MTRQKASTEKDKIQRRLDYEDHLLRAGKKAQPRILGYDAVEQVIFDFLRK